VQGVHQIRVQSLGDSESVDLSGTHTTLSVPGPVAQAAGHGGGAGGARRDGGR
jgi:hypothetical protein